MKEAVICLGPAKHFRGCVQGQRWELGAPSSLLCVSSTPSPPSLPLSVPQPAPAAALALVPTSRPFQTRRETQTLNPPLLQNFSVTKQEQINPLKPPPSLLFAAAIGSHLSPLRAHTYIIVHMYPNRRGIQKKGVWLLFFSLLKLSFFHAKSFFSLFFVQKFGFSMSPTYSMWNISYSSIVYHYIRWMSLIFPLM